MNQVQIEQLKKIGNEWQKGNYQRVYFNDLGARLGIETERYNSGNIRSAWQDGQCISNSQARRILSRTAYSKLWFDIPSGQFQTKGELTSDEFDRIVASIVAEVEGT